MIFRAPLAPLCAPAMAAALVEPADLLRAPLLRSYRPQDWPAWFRAVGLEAINVRGPMLMVKHVVPHILSLIFSVPRILLSHSLIGRLPIFIDQRGG